MRILVIGGTRFIGLAAVRALADAGHDITIFHRGQTEPDLPASVKHIHCSDASPAFIGWKVQFLPRFIDDFRRIAPDVVLDAIRLPPHLIEGIDTQQELLVDITRIRQEPGYNKTIPLGRSAQAYRCLGARESATEARSSAIRLRRRRCSSGFAQILSWFAIPILLEEGAGDNYLLHPPPY
jgi:hypothetical protein